MAVSILGEATISIIVEVAMSIEVVVVSSFRAMATNRSDDSPRRGRVERIMKGIEGSEVSEFCDSEDCTKPNKQETLISDQELETNKNNLISDRS